MNARKVAYEVLRRIERDGAYANLVLGRALERSDLTDQDRRFATDLVYGTTRMRRACDALVDRFVTSPPDDATRTLLRLGAYQLAFGDVAAHAAVSETVALSPRRTRGFVNAVLRRTAASIDDMVWPSPFARLSYPDWIARRLVDELGEDDAFAAMARMNVPAQVTVRPDGYVQDESSQWVAAAVESTAGERVLDACAAPGGKATALAATGADVVAADVRPSRLALVARNAERLGLAVPAVVADATSSPFTRGSFDAVLVDAPCSGLGALRRRPDARWRVESSDVDDLVALQDRILAETASLVRPGGRLVYSVCTLTAAESIDHPVPSGFEIDDRVPTVGSWREYGHGWRVLPQDADTDGMILIRYHRVAGQVRSAP
jgi:16S rRNA (cytosine967-C5)-methyltransferase